MQGVISRGYPLDLQSVADPLPRKPYDTGLQLLSLATVEIR
ncbi:hypothetical protein EYZ11_007576 [Aspergillus tanneri]|uniref:Uncharacterized protein n=1 Tax=Aspergillus tanneri TaxID=1220188 RepID=A0A4S3JCM1_9EURO|nr:hypothetical protein EYZ11_007576 [Aspergillus tanneri]